MRIELDGTQKEILLKIFRGIRKVLIAHPEENSGDVVKEVQEFLLRTKHFPSEDRVMYHCAVQDYLYQHRKREDPVDCWRPGETIRVVTEIIDDIEKLRV